jgi:hypothetical protein
MPGVSVDCVGLALWPAPAAIVSAYVRRQMVGASWIPSYMLTGAPLVCLLVCDCAQAVNALVVGTSHRFKGKYITSVLYKPRGQHSSSGAAGSNMRRTSMQQQQPFAGQQPQHH